MTLKRQTLIAIMLAILLALPATVRVARGNGAPVSLYLSWLPGISNWTNARAATGSAIVSVSLGELKLEVEGLEHLVTGQYEVWLVTEDMKQMVSMGRFNSDMLDQAKYDAVREDVPANDYRYLLISVEPEPDSDPASSGDWAIGAIFPDAALLVVTATPPGGAGAGETGGGGEAGAGPTATPMPPPPQALPVTGGTPGTATSGWLLGFGAIVVAIGLVWLGRRRVA